MKAKSVLTPQGPASATSRAGAAWEVGWVRHWELWLALAVGAFLRFWHLDLTTFLMDQRYFIMLARTAAVRHMVPVTSVPYSVGGNAPPFAIYLALPFAAVTKDPLPLVVSIAVWNVLGIALCYRFALKYFGRMVAGFGTLLFATCGVAVNYSRFIWQPNYESTFLVLWALALFAWCIGGRTRWFVVSGILLVALVQITPVAVLLIVIMCVAWLMAPRRPSIRELAVLAVALLILLAPTLVWEIITRGLDVRLLAASSGGHATVSLAFLRVLYIALGAPSTGDLGPASLYARFGGWYEAINLAAALFFAAGYLIISWRVAVPAASAWRTQPSNGERGKRLASRLIASWQTLRADKQWCVHTLLWLWVTLPALSMVRHTSAPTVHYILLAYPALFLVAAYPLRFLAEIDVVHWLTGRQLPHVRGWQVGQAAGIALVCLLITAQAVQSALYPASLTSSGFDALHFYGYPLAEMQATDRTISALQREQKAASVYISLPADDRYRLGMDYLLVGEHRDRVGYADNCLVLPPPGASPALLVSASPTSPTDAALPMLPNVRHVTDISMVGGAPFHLYEINGAVPALPGESAITPAVYRASSVDAFRLDAAAMVVPGKLRLRWTVLAAGSGGQAPEQYHIQAATVDGGKKTRLGAVDCQPTRWQAGETVFTWVSVSTAAVATAPGSVAITVSASAPQLYAPTLGPIHLLSGRYINDNPVVLPAAAASSDASGTAASRPGTIAPDGSYNLPLNVLPSP